MTSLEYINGKIKSEQEKTAVKREDSYVVYQQWHEDRVRIDKIISDWYVEEQYKRLDFSFNVEELRRRIANGQ